MFTISRTRTLVVSSAVVAALSAAGWSHVNGLKRSVDVGLDNNSFDNEFVQPQDPALSGGGRDQSLQFGDLLTGSPAEDLLIGRLGTDLLFGAGSNDVLIGGTEHFNPSNRDRAFGGGGNDLFLWSPGDGSDFFHGGEGDDALVLGLMGELDDNGNLTFKVSTDEKAGNVYIDPNDNLPLMDLRNSPGFCEVVDDSTAWDSADQLDALGLDHLVRFFIRSAADGFANGEQDTDNGLRVTIHLKGVEFVVCTTREGGRVEAFDLRTSPPTPISIRSIPIPALTEIVL